MAPRPYWKGYLKLSLVACPVSVFTATTSSERVSFRQINKQTGNRLRQQLVDDVTREPVEAADKVRGYEIDKNVYIQVEDEEIEALEIESNHTIDIDSFVPRAQIDERYLDSTLLHRAERSGRPRGVRGDPRSDARQGHGRRWAASCWPSGSASSRCSRGTMDCWARRCGTPTRCATRGNISTRFPNTKVPKDMLQLAEHILESKTGDFDPTTFVDHYEEAVVEMLKHKQAGAPVSKQKAAAPASNVVNLMDALRRSVAQEKGAGKAPGEEGQVEGQAGRPAPAAAVQIPDRGRQGQAAEGRGCAGSKQQGKAQAQIGVAGGRFTGRREARSWSARAASSAR